LSGYDHILFVIIVTVPFIFKDWKRLLILISVFTLGHTLSLILGVYDIVNLNVNVTEWLIPITIFFAAFTIFSRQENQQTKRPYLMYGVVLFFGLFTAWVLPMLLKALVQHQESTFLSILEFSVGIEIGQFIIVFCVLF